MSGSRGPVQAIIRDVAESVSVEPPPYLRGRSLKTLNGSIIMLAKYAHVAWRAERSLTLLACKLIVTKFKVNLVTSRSSFGYKVQNGLDIGPIVRAWLSNHQ